MKQAKLKRNAGGLAIVLFVSAAVYMNWSYTEEANGKILGEATLVAGEPQSTNPNATDTPDDTSNTLLEESAYFAEARLNRQEARDSALSLLQQAAADAGATQEVIEEANLAIQTMANHTLAEAQIENLVVAKGYENCVAFLNDNSISVVVSTMTEALEATDVAKIGEIVIEQTGLGADQIKIIEAE